MRVRDNNGLHLAAWITDSEGNPFSEYDTREVVWKVGGKDIPAVECWITAVEGSRFFVNWQVQFDEEDEAEDDEDEDNADEDKLPERGILNDLRCLIWFDGEPLMSPGILEVDDIVSGFYGTMTGDEIDSEPGKARPYQFGKLVCTDDTENIQPDDPGPEFLNTIHVRLEWGFARRIMRGAPRSTPRNPPSKNRGPVLESNVKNGNQSSVRLGDPAPCEDIVDYEFEFKQARRQPIWFAFYYASAEWLKAEGHMPCSPKIGTPRLELQEDFKPATLTDDRTRPPSELERTDVNVLSDSEFEPGDSGYKARTPEFELLEDIKPTTPIDECISALERLSSGPEYIDVDALSDSEPDSSESESKTFKPEPLEDTKPTRAASSSCCNCNCKRTRTRPEPEHMVIDRFGDSESNAVTSKLEPLEDTKPITHIRTRKRRRPERDYIDVDSFSDSEAKPTTALKLESADLKPERNPRGSRSMGSAGTPREVVIDEDITLLSHFILTRTEVPLVGPNSNKRVKLVPVYEEDDLDIKPKTEELA